MLQCTHEESEQWKPARDLTRAAVSIPSLEHLSSMLIGADNLSNREVHVVQQSARQSGRPGGEACSRKRSAPRQTRLEVTRQKCQRRRRCCRLLWTERLVPPQLDSNCRNSTEPRWEP